MALMNLETFQAIVRSRVLGRFIAVKSEVGFSARVTAPTDIPYAVYAATSSKKILNIKCRDLHLLAIGQVMRLVFGSKMLISLSNIITNHKKKNKNTAVQKSQTSTFDTGSRNKSDHNDQYSHILSHK